MPSRTALPLARRARATAAATAALAALTACGGAAPAPERLEPASDEITVEEGLTYWSDGTDTLRLDACLPAPADFPGPTPALLLVHGGGFTEGDREGGGMRGLCELAAQLGVAGFSVDYRLAPEHVWPDPVDDLAAAVRWLREPAQAQRFAVDPARIGVLGSSAGATLALSLATRGSGPLDEGERVAAVVALSGASALTPEALALGSPSPVAVQLVLTYLGCTDPTSCPQGAQASPVTAVDPTDPPALLVNGTAELVPVEQAQILSDALTAAGVGAEVVLVDGADHGTALLGTDVRRRVAAFLEENL